MNRDGKLSKVELAERYVARSGGKGRIESGKKKSSGSSSSSRDDRSSRWDRYRKEREEREKAEKAKSSSASKSTSLKKNSSSKRSGSSSRNDKVASYAKSILTKYDKDGDKLLSKAEVKDVKSLPSGADKNKDGNVSLDELIVGYGGSASSSSGRASRTRNTQNNPYIVKNGMDRNSEADGDFQDLDKNVDGLIQMHEFAKTWTDEIAEQFINLDKDNNGVVTTKEWSKGGGMRSSRSSSTSRSSKSSSSRFSRDRK